jgi:hypothetical protein
MVLGKSLRATETSLEVFVSNQGHGSFSGLLTTGIKANRSKNTGLEIVRQGCQREFGGVPSSMCCMMCGSSSN